MTDKDGNPLSPDAAQGMRNVHEDGDAFSTTVESTRDLNSDLKVIGPGTGSPPTTYLGGKDLYPGTLVRKTVDGKYQYLEPPAN